MAAADSEEEIITFYLSDFEEEINTLVTTGLIFSDDGNSLIIKNSASTTTKDQENEFDDFDHNTDEETSENENGSTLNEENISYSPKYNFSILAERLDTLRNFLCVKSRITVTKRHQKKYLLGIRLRLSFF